MTLDNSFHILIVEDSNSERMFIHSVINAIEFEHGDIHIQSCADGEQALSLCQQAKFDLVVSDWRMPKLTGIDLCVALKQQKQQPYVLLLTGNSQDDDLVFAMSSGADDYLSKPFAPKVLQIRVIAALRIIVSQRSLQLQQRQLQHTLNLNQTQLQSKQLELQQAAQLQQSLLPEHSFKHNNWQAHHCFMAANELAGDMMQCIAIDEQHLGFFIVDITGHGAGPAMLSFTLTQQLSPNQVDWQKTPAELMRHLNQRFVDPAEQGTFATVLIGKLNTLTGELQLSNAGHPRPMLITPHGTEEINMPSHLPIGICDSTEYRNWTGQINVQDKLMIFSDGAYEVQHQRHGMFGLQRLIKLCQAAAAEAPEQLLSQLRYYWKLWQQGEQQDDISVLLLSPLVKSASSEPKQHPHRTESNAENQALQQIPAKQITTKEQPLKKLQNAS
ncbi:fused response regulator/phosphatase [Shewanella maritima]|uniref:Fused response regulator/phosphatase n=1 Tax=Shewanella maritima TaxID=2520507 RepID=A0A411PL31_9GAMM|nr:fused response regulator/phosphatase [Shewanella maritima]QBF84229.1 fused response regulator/phosphatase [Shewanella maritima]